MRHRVKWRDGDEANRGWEGLEKRKRGHTSQAPEGKPGGYTAAALTQLKEIFSWAHLPWASLELRTNMSIKGRGAASSGVYQVYKPPHFKEQASHVGGRGGCSGQFLAFSMEGCAGRSQAGFGVILPRLCHGNAPRITAGNLWSSLWSFHIKPSFFLHPAGLVCQGHDPVPSLALPQASWQAPWGAVGPQWVPWKTGQPPHPPCAHSKGISRSPQPASSASEAATGCKTGQWALITRNYHKSSSILAFLPLLPPELWSLINWNRTFLSPLIAASNISCLEG